MTPGSAWRGLGRETERGEPCVLGTQISPEGNSALGPTGGLWDAGQDVCVRDDVPPQLAHITSQDSVAEGAAEVAVGHGLAFQDLEGRRASDRSCRVS